jgi:hypothetical protein
MASGDLHHEIDRDSYRHFTGLCTRDLRASQVAARAAQR